MTEHVVGEQRPELFVPGTHGSILDGDGWLIARFDVMGEREVAWGMPLMQRLGLDPEDFFVTVTISTGPQLHLSRFLRDADGHKRRDLNLNVAATEPVVVDITTDDLPPWLRTNEE